MTKRLKTVERWSLLALLPVFALLLVQTLFVIRSSEPYVNACTGLGSSQPGLPPGNALEPYLLALVAVAGLLSGRRLGYARRLLHDEPFPVHKGVRMELWVQKLLVGFLSVATGALMYESFGTSPHTFSEPITQYVRCAAASQMPLTAAASFFVFLLIGSWLWYPTPSATTPIRTAADGTGLSNRMATASRRARRFDVSSALLTAAGPVLAFVALLIAPVHLIPTKSYGVAGFYVLAVVVYGILLIAAWFERAQTVRHNRAIGHYVNGFVMAYPWLAGVFALLVGAMIAHFFVGLDDHHWLKDVMIQGISRVLAADPVARTILNLLGWHLMVS